MNTSDDSDPITIQVRPLPRALLYALDLLFLLSMALLPLAWLMDPLNLAIGSVKLRAAWGAKPLVAPIVVIALRWLVRTWTRSADPGANGLLGVKWVAVGMKLMVSLYLTVGLLEGALSIMGYELKLPPVLFALENEAGEVEEQKGYADPELIFKFRKGEKYYGVEINALGFRDREVDPEKAPGMMRVICMGDSCTAQGKPGYSGYLHKMLAEKPLSDSAWEAFNMAVYGYSSLQGLRVFQKQGKYLGPDVVSLYFGWNDHWFHEQSDRARMAVRMPPFQARLYGRLCRKRSFMMIKQVVEPGLRFSKPRAVAAPRVPHDEFRAVLIEYVEEVRSVGATPLLITAPRRDVNTEEKRQRYPSLNIDYNAIHDDYMDITREVAAEYDVDVLDLHRSMATEAFDEYFTGDGIHLTQTALKYIGRVLYEKLAEMQGNKRIPSAFDVASCGGCDAGCTRCS